MQTLTPCCNNKSLLNKFYKNLTLFLFFILPSKIANIFINLSILAIIYDIRNINFCTDKINTDRIHSLLKVTVSEEILLLPNYTIHWFWDENFLNTKTTINNQEYTLKEIIRDSGLFFNHMRLVIGMFLNHLPNSMKLKLGVSDTKKRIEVKHNLMNILIYS